MKKVFVLIASLMLSSCGLTLGTSYQYPMPLEYRDYMPQLPRRLPNLIIHRPPMLPPMHSLFRH